MKVLSFVAIFIISVSFGFYSYAEAVPPAVACDADNNAEIQISLADIHAPNLANGSITLQGKQSISLGDFNVSVKWTFFNKAVVTYSHPLDESHNMAMVTIDLSLPKQEASGNKFSGKIEVMLNGNTITSTPAHCSIKRKFLDDFYLCSSSKLIPCPWEIPGYSGLIPH